MTPTEPRIQTSDTHMPAAGNHSLEPPRITRPYRASRRGSAGRRGGRIDGAGGGAGRRIELREGRGGGFRGDGGEFGSGISVGTVDWGAAESGRREEDWREEGGERGERGGREVKIGRAHV